MAKYFTISTGMRGCYLPDTAYTFKANTRRELKEALADEYRIQVTEGECFGNRDMVATVAAAAWREAKKARPSIYDHVVPFAMKRQGAAAWGIFCSVSTRADYVEYLNSGWEG